MSCEVAFAVVLPFIVSILIIGSVFAGDYLSRRIR